MSDAWVLEQALAALELCAADDVRVNGCACTTETKCYLHGVIVRVAMNDLLAALGKEAEPSAA